MQVQPGSQHAKFLPAIRETIAKAKSARIFEEYKQCVEGLKIPTLHDIRRTYQCTLAEAEKRGLIAPDAITLCRKVFAEDFSDVFVTEGMDGFTYQVDNGDKQPKVYALCIDGAKITDELFRGIKLVSGGRAFPAAENLIKSVMSEETPTFELSSGTSLKECSIGFGNLAAVLPKDKQAIWADVDDLLGQIVNERGYRSDPHISTWQEHQLGGSTVWRGYSEQPYKPLGITHLEMDSKQFEQLGIEETKVARELGVFTGVHFSYYGLPDDGTRLHVFFEPLDSGGNTIRDPRAIDISRLGGFLKLYPLEDAIEKCLIPGVVKRADFHNRRD